MNHPLPDEIRLPGDKTALLLRYGNADYHLSAEQMLRTGRRTVSTTVRDNAEITIVGELPPQTAKRISDSIKFRAAQ